MDPLTTTWIELAFLLLVAVASHFVIARAKHPLVVGELIIGVVIAIIASSFLGIKIVQDEVLQVMGQLGAIILLFMIGLECDLKKVFAKRSVLIGSFGVGATWGIVYFVFRLMQPGSSLGETILVSAIFVSTSVAVTASILKEMKMISGQVGTAIIGAAVVDDVLGMLTLAISKGVVQGDFSISSIAITIGASIAFIVLGTWLGIKVIAKFLDRMEHRGKKLGLLYTDFTLGLAIALLYAVVAEIIGISAIVGAFVAGAVFATSPIKQQIEAGTKYIGAIFVPIFFITTGMLFYLPGLLAVLPLAIAFLLIAIFSKLVGCGGAARATGMTSRESLSVGLGMAPRLEIPMVIATYGVTQGIIGNDILSMAIFVGIASSLIGPLLFRHALLYQNKGSPPEMTDILEKKKAPEKAES